MKKFIATVNGKKYEVEIELAEGQELNSPSFNTYSSQRTISSISPRSTGNYSKHKADGAAKARTSSSDENSLSAPFNGAVLEVNVKPGDVVREGDVLFVFEAMKMKTNVSSPREGKISEILVSAGDTVESGRVLLRYE